MDPALRSSRDTQNVLTIWMDLPGKPVNTCSPQMLDELSAAMDDIEQHKPAGVIFASAKAHSFSAGADLFELRRLSGDQLSQYLEHGQSLFERIARLPMPTVAAINGSCLGGGFELALACKRRVAAEDTSISIGLPEIKLGLIPAWGGTTRLPRLIGLRQALPILLAGKTMPPRKALKAGLIDEVVRPEALMSAAYRLVRAPAPQRQLWWVDRGVVTFPALRRRFLDMARHRTQLQTRGNYPAPLALIEVIQSGYEKGFAAGLEAERHALLKLIATDAGRNLLRLFFLRQGGKKAVMAQIHAQPHEVQYTAVIGGGTMGAGIAHALARAGMFVRLVEVDPPAVSAALGRIRKIFDEDVWAGRLDRLAAQQAFNRVSPTIDWTGLELAELVVEAVLEKIDTKRDVFSRLDRIARPTAVLATNTSSLRVADIAQTTLHAERVVGMHFFNPVPKMPLVEIVRGPHSDDASLATVLGVAGRIGKTPVLINDGPGFLVNRILVPYLAEGLIVASQGTPITIIDHALKAWGMPMGPFELLDEIGLDIAAHIFQLMEQGSVLPSTISGLFLQAMENHWLGKKSGRGFYEYSAQSRHSKSPRPNAELVEVLRASSQPDIQKSDASIQERLVLPMVNEAAKLMEEGITDSTDTIDLATVLGIGLAPFRGGIVQYANTVGMEQIVNQMENLAAQHGRQFAPARLLRQAAQEHRPLSSVERVVPSLLYAGERVG